MLDGNFFYPETLKGKLADSEVEAVVPDGRLDQERDGLSGPLPLFFLVGVGVLEGASRTYFSAVNGE
ncbi:MAG TPA: hypothetical protein VMW60_03855 [Dehalococcoidales bacterium]|nr:hypothetical protein [Dehalococcoidales bacterium]